MKSTGWLRPCDGFRSDSKRGFVEENACGCIASSRESESKRTGCTEETGMSVDDVALLKTIDLTSRFGLALTHERLANRTYGRGILTTEQVKSKVAPVL